MVAVLWMLLAAVPVLLIVTSWRRYWLAAQLPGPILWVPVLGNLIDTLYLYGLSGLSWAIGYHERFGDVYRLWIGGSLMVITSNPDDIKAITTDPALIDKSQEYSTLKPWLGDGLLLIGGKKWQARRKLLNPAFHYSILEQFVDIFNRNSDILESKLMVAATKASAASARAFDIRPYISRHSLDIICETAMGTPVNAQLQEDSEYVKAVKVACAMIDRRQTHPWLRNDTLFRLSASGKSFNAALDVLHGFTKKVIDARKSELQKNRRESPEEDATTGSKRYMVFIDHLINMHLLGEDLSEKDIFDEVNTFMFAGHDTTMTSICFTLFELAGHPEVQERAAEEVLRVVGDADRITTAHLADLKYVEAVIDESLRLHPSVPVFFRNCAVEYKLPSGYRIPAGSTISVNTYMSHMDERNFKDPHKFDPDRFLVQDTSRHHFAYLPFSARFRSCIGQRFAMMSMKATLARLLRAFIFEPALTPSGDRIVLDIDVTVVLTTKNGVPLVLRPRNPTVTE